MRAGIVFLLVLPGCNGRHLDGFFGETGIGIPDTAAEPLLLAPSYAIAASDVTSGCFHTEGQWVATCAADVRLLGPLAGGTQAFYTTLHEVDPDEDATWAAQGVTELERWWELDVSEGSDGVAALVGTYPYAGAGRLERTLHAAYSAGELPTRAVLIEVTGDGAPRRELRIDDVTLDALPQYDDEVLVGAGNKVAFAWSPSAGEIVAVTKNGNFVDHTPEGCVSILRAEGDGWNVAFAWTDGEIVQLSVIHDGVLQTLGGVGWDGGLLAAGGAASSTAMAYTAEDAVWAWDGGQGTGPRLLYPFEEDWVPEGRAWGTPDVLYIAEKAKGASTPYARVVAVDTRGQRFESDRILPGIEAADIGPGGSLVFGTGPTDSDPYEAFMWLPTNEAHRIESGPKVLVLSPARRLQ